MVSCQLSLPGMDVVALFQRLCHVGIRRLLMIVGLAIIVITVFQCSDRLNGKLLSLSTLDNGLVVLLTGNATLSNGLMSSKAHIFSKVASDTDTFDLVQGVGNDDPETEDTDRDNKSVPVDVGHNDFKSKSGVTLGKSLVMEHATSTDTGYSSTQAKGTETGPDHLEQLEKFEASIGLRFGGPQNGVGILPVVDSRTSTETREILDTSSRPSDPVFYTNLPAEYNVAQPVETPPKNTGLMHAVSITLKNNSATTSISTLREMQRTSISQMNLILLQNRVSPLSTKPRWSSARDHELLSAKLEIENAHVVRNAPGLHASAFWNVSMFKRSYELMERMLKVYIYKEGEKPIFHQSKMRGIYASEGWFMKLIEANRKFVNQLEEYLKNYVDLIAQTYNFWNRTGGADHFLVGCHDWASRITRHHMRNCIRVLCNANVAKGFKIGKDVTLPVTYIRSAENPLRDLGGKPPSERLILAFFAGGMHGYLRPVLLKHWENKEPDMKIFGPMPRDIDGKRIYREYMKSSKYCICARGYEVHTPRVVEAIFYECVPVIISDNYVPPFFEVLNWESFSVFVKEKDVPNLRNILLSIPKEKYLAMQSSVKMVQQHFLWHKKPVKYDLFHMILHSVWHNRIFQMKPT